jgi:hypothetical protein
VPGGQAWPRGCLQGLRLGTSMQMIMPWIAAVTYLPFGPGLKGLFGSLNEEMHGAEGIRWGTCDLVVDQP